MSKKCLPPGRRGSSWSIEAVIKESPSDLIPGGGSWEIVFHLVSSRGWACSKITARVLTFLLDYSGLPALLEENKTNHKQHLACRAIQYHVLELNFALLVL